MNHETKSKLLDLSIPEHAYLYGLLQTDGHMSKQSRNRGRVQLELQIRDKYILDKLATILPISSSVTIRKRDTNFAKDYESASWNICNLQFRTELNELGLPYGKKSNSIEPPAAAFSEIDYARGLLDGDGSLGITSKGRPFVAFTTDSEHIAKWWINFAYKHTNFLYSANRNSRDGVFNITASMEKAVVLANILYYDEALALPRKQTKALEVTSWQRSEGSRQNISTEKKKWSVEENEYIQNHAIGDSMALLGRSKKAITTQLWRLKSNKNK